MMDIGIYLNNTIMPILCPQKQLIHLFFNDEKKKKKSRVGNLSWHFSLEHDYSDTLLAGLRPTKT